MGTVNLGRVRDRVTGVERINGNGSAGTIDTYRVSFESSNYYDFNVTNGRNGVGQIVSFSGNSVTKDNLIFRIVNNQDKVLALLVKSSEQNDGYMQASFKVEKTLYTEFPVVHLYGVTAYSPAGSQLFIATYKQSLSNPEPGDFEISFSSGFEACLDAWCLLYYNDSSTGVTVDDELSDSSTNPVQNKVVTEEFNKYKSLSENYAVNIQFEDTSANILALTSDNGTGLGTDTGHWYYWNGTQYADGGTYQATQIDENKSNIEYLTTISKGLERMYPSGYIPNKFYSNGTLNDTSSRDLCIYDLTDIDKVIIKGTSIKYVNAYTFLDSNDNPVHYYQSTTSGDDFEYIIDCTNYSKLAVSVNFTISEPNQSTFYTYVYKYNNLALCKPRDDSHLKNRNIVWLGTSIPAGGTLGLNDPYSYPNILGKLLDCNMYNESVGSSCLHCRQTNLVNADTNPYGFVSSFQTASRCLTNTLEMMEWIINWIDYTINGGTYQNEGVYSASVFTSSLPSTFTSDDANFIRSCSYESKVDKYLNSTTMKPDMFVIDHGHNDYPYNDNVWDESNPYSTFSYKGAVLFLLNHIYSKCPRIKILFMGHYENTYKSYIAEEQETLATYTNTEIFKLWEKLPFSYNVKCETTGYWYDNYGLWVDSGGTEQTIRMYDLWLRDGMHPHSDFTHRCERYIADVIYPYINNVIIYNPIRNVTSNEGE